MRLLLALLLVCSAHAQTGPAAFEGTWSGEIAVPSAPLGFSASFSADGDELSGTLSIPAQNLSDFTLSGVAVRSDSLFFRMDGVPGTPSFAGLRDGDAVEGAFVQGGGRLRFAMTRDDAPDPALGALGSLPAFVDSVRAAFNVPGLALAVVRADTVLLLHASGLRDVEGGLPVTADTQFPIGSSTKAFVGALLGTLVDDGRLGWDEPVRRYLPEFALHDPVASEGMTAVDLLTHRSGLPRHDLLWYGTPHTREELIVRLRHLEPTEPFRSAWQYQNLMFMVAGYLGGELDGTSWEDATRRRLFDPLGMDHATFSVARMQARPDYARGYAGGLDSTGRMPYRDLDAVGPAGSINASAREMARWVQLQLGEGEVQGRRILDASTLRQLHAPNAVVRSAGDEAAPYTMYAKGWFVEPVHGRRMLHHGGNIDGFSALVGFLPDDDLGVALLTNQNASPLPRPLMLTVFDRLLGNPEASDWTDQALVRTRALADQQTDGDRTRVEGTRPAHELDAYAGAYVHPAYDTLRVRADGGLALRYFAVDEPLEHVHFETFEVGDSFLDGTRITFRTDADGRVDGLEVALEPMLGPLRFERAASSELTRPDVLAAYAGRYNLRGQTVVIEAAPGGLRATLPGQPTYTLAPQEAGYFTIEGLNGFAVRFEADGSALTFEQPNGQFEATRIEP